MDQNQTVSRPAEKKSSPWPWVIGGCLLVVIIIAAIVVGLGWWGARKVKQEMQNYQPNVEGIKESIDEMNKEAEEWQKKSEDFRNSVPDPEELQKEMEKNYPPVR
jgi:Tfp pilus assembly protein PilO